MEYKHLTSIGSIETNEWKKKWLFVYIQRLLWEYSSILYTYNIDYNIGTNDRPITRRTPRPIFMYISSIDVVIEFNTFSYIYVCGTLQKIAEQRPLYWSTKNENNISMIWQWPHTASSIVFVCCFSLFFFFLSFVCILLAFQSIEIDMGEHKTEFSQRWPIELNWQLALDGHSIYCLLCSSTSVFLATATVAHSYSHLKNRMKCIPYWIEFLFFYIYK